MLDTKEIDFDLDRCEKVLRENDYMEIVIAIEELQDKYRDKIDYIIENENNVIWNNSIIEEVNIEKINLDDKYEELRVCFDILKHIDREMSIYILELITLVIK
ncbi:hypothetical protein QX51_15955 [Terrisporobacter othiniensis]|uniref:Uncharacterized protein n=1 Tax=Terrisporobacter othiniensis TaxID=1577792 RepID=A0A0B3VTU8_9FIRM|nr:hypothetical protein [Terrisporobacter othiniensis]KHS56054.1 hypothetical protein QX51_15955 [Terrisporobacter othiniensis]